MYLLKDIYMHEIVFQSPISVNMINLKSPAIQGINYSLHTLNTFAANELKRSDPPFNLREDFMNDSLSPNVRDRVTGNFLVTAEDC